MIGSAPVDPSGADTATTIPINIDLTVAAGATYAFYVTATNGGTLSNGINYLLSVPTGSVQTEDTNLRILGGKGKNYPFGSNTFLDKGVSATVNYDVCSP